MNAVGAEGTWTAGSGTMLSDHFFTRSSLMTVNRLFLSNQFTGHLVPDILSRRNSGKQVGVVKNTARDSRTFRGKISTC